MENFILGLLTLIWGLVLTIKLYNKIKEDFTKEEMLVIFYSLMFNISFSFVFAGLDIMFLR